MLNSTSKEWKHMSKEEKQRWEDFYRDNPVKHDRGEMPWDKYKDGYLPPRPPIVSIPWGEDDT